MMKLRKGALKVTVLTLASMLIWGNNANCVNAASYEDQYLVGDWDGDGRDNIAVRRGLSIVMDTNFDGMENIIQNYGNGNSEDQYLVGDWDGDGRDNIAVRRGLSIVMDTNFDGMENIIHNYGNGNSEDQYLVGDWDGDGRDNIAVRRGLSILMDTNFDGVEDITQNYGNGNSEDQYLVGDWDGDGRDNIAVRRGLSILMDTNFDGIEDIVQNYGNGNSEDQYLVGDWDGDGRDNIAVRRGASIVMDTNFDGMENIIQNYGNGTNSAVVIDSLTEKRNKVVEIAKQQLGKPYVYGAAGPNSFDCSGLVCFAYKQIGITLNRTTYDQIKQGIAVSRNALLPGDLVFPTTGHVMIYVGNGQCIHAPQPGDVVRYTNIYQFYAARRIIY